MDNDQPKVDVPPIRVVDVPAETLLMLIVYKDGNVHVETNESPQWVVAALRDIANNMEDKR